MSSTRDASVPRFTLPPDACDAHCHVFGPQTEFPYVPDRPYTPAEEAPETALSALHRRLGVSRTVLVQPACYGTDHRALLGAIARAPQRRRGVALLPEPVDAGTLKALHEGGVRGVRFNFVGHLGERPELDAIRRLADAIAPLGWHLALHLGISDLEMVAPLLDGPVPVVLDHMARINAGDGKDHTSLRALIDWLGSERAWIKLSGADRASSLAEGYGDVVPIARSIAEAAPDRIVWGTDWPHPNVRHQPDDDALVAFIPAMVPDRARQLQMLVDNPARLYGFAPR